MKSNFETRDRDIYRERAEMTMSDNSIGLILATTSSAFIGSSFILKKKGLKRAGASGTRAGELLLIVEFDWGLGVLWDFCIVFEV